MTKKKKPKEVFKTKCAWCGKNIQVSKYEETLKPSVKADKKIWVETSKDTQSKLKTGGSD